GPTPAFAAVCEACGARLGAARLKYRGLRYRRCGACGARALATMPSESQLRVRYEAAYPRTFAPTRIRAPRHQMLGGLLAHARRHVAPGRLLDVGCGGGHFVHAARAEGWRAIGTDLSHSACVAAHGRAGALVAQAQAGGVACRDGAPEAGTPGDVLRHH